MNKLEAAEKLAVEVARAHNLLKERGIADDIADKLGIAWENYNTAPAMPSPERILEAMETLNKVALGAEWVKVAKSSEALDVLSELRKAIKGNESKTS